MSSDPFNLHRFLQAQAEVYSQALSEIRRGEKRSHWMWFVFPQFAGLGRSTTAVFYAIRSKQEAEAYLAHPVLGTRLVECSDALLALKGSSASDMFGFPDDMKLRSSMTLFAAVSPPGSVFGGVLGKYFNGELDEETLKLLG